MDVQRNKACEKICYPETPKARLIQSEATKQGH